MALLFALSIFWWRMPLRSVFAPDDETLFLLLDGVVEDGAGGTLEVPDRCGCRFFAIVPFVSQGQSQREFKKVQ